MRRPAAQARTRGPHPAADMFCCMLAPTALAVLHCLPGSPTRQRCPREGKNLRPGEPTLCAPYHSRMRRGLSLLLMVVLVLRGLTGTAMAAGVLPPLQPPAAPHSHIQADTARAAPHTPAEAHQAPTAAHGAHSAHGTHHGSPPPPESTATEPEADHDHHDHDHDHALAAPAAADAAACNGASTGCAAHDHHASACSACEICHSAMLDVPAALTLAHQPPGPLRALSAAPFDSAPAALAIKPPIA